MTVSFSANDNGGRRLGLERRRFSYTAYIPERRSGEDRRSGLDRRRSIRQDDEQEGCKDIILERERGSAERGCS